MNRFVKDNVILVISISATCVVALGLLIYGIIEWVRISELMDETESLRGKIKTLINVRPAPVDGNKQPIQEDAQAYVKLAEELSPVFDSPLRQARNAFLRKLYNLKPEDNIDEAANKFLELFNERVNSKSNITEKRMAWTKLHGEFKNWNAAAEEFRKAAVKAGVNEEQLEKYINGVVLAELGIPRTMNEDKAEFLRFYNDTMANLRERMGERLSKDNNFGLVAPGSGGSNFDKADYPLVARHSAILADIVGRIADSKIETFDGIVIRGNGENMSSTFSEENGCRISHYTFEVNGSLDSIRDLAKRFDNAQKDNRFYIVRSVFLYWPENERNLVKNIIFPPVQNDENGGEVAAETENQSGGLFGGGRRARLARQKQAEAQQKEKELEKKRNAAEEAMREREKSAKLHERHGYGDIKLGDISRYKAIFDIDYIERI